MQEVPALNPCHATKIDELALLYLDRVFRCPDERARAVGRARDVRDEPHPAAWETCRDDGAVDR
jgi:hypothetical protein